MKLNKIGDVLGDDDYGITNIRRLGKYDSKSSRPRSLLISFNTPWTVRKILARANALCQYNLDNGTTIDVLKNSSNTFALLNRSQSQPLCILNRKLLRMQFHKVLSPSTLLPVTRSLLLFDLLKPNLVPTTLIHPKIQSICETIDYRKVTGPDQIPGIIFQNCSKTLSKSISQIFYKIKQSAVFPSVWKNSIVSPVHKKGSKSDVLNYRPVSPLLHNLKKF